MNPSELPTREQILRHTVVNIARIDKNGTPVSTAGQQRTQWMDITPEIAGTWLRNNFRNRPIKDDTVRAYARDMLNGQWVATHQGVAFNDQDHLIDGQHRLRAIVLANITVRMMVTFGLPSQIPGKEVTTMDCVDRGATRSVADQLTIQHGFKFGSLTASICGSIAGICCGERTRRLSVGQTLEVFRAFQASIGWVIDKRSKIAGLKAAGVAAAFAFAMEVNEAKIQEMFGRLNLGDEQMEYPIIGLLRAFLTSDEAKLLSRSLDRGLAEMTLQVLFLELHHRTIDKLEVSIEGVNWFRAQQKNRVEKIAAIFELPPVSPEPDPQPEPTPEPMPTQVPAEKQYICECGKKYVGKKNDYGCPDCHRAFLIAEKRHVGVRPSREHAFADAV